MQEQLLPLPKPKPLEHPQPHCVADKSLMLKPPIKLLWFILFSEIKCVKKEYCIFRVD